VDPSKIREFVGRRWDRVEEQKLKARAERYRAGGAAGCLEALAGLRARFRRVHPQGWSENSRRRDLDHDVVLSPKLRRFGDGLVRR
jgi:hypothetical protein